MEWIMEPASGGGPYLVTPECAVDICGIDVQPCRGVIDICLVDIDIEP